MNSRKFLLHEAHKMKSRKFLLHEAHKKNSRKFLLHEAHKTSNIGHYRFERTGENFRTLP